MQYQLLTFGNQLLLFDKLLAYDYNSQGIGDRDKGSVLLCLCITTLDIILTGGFCMIPMQHYYLCYFFFNHIVNMHTILFQHNNGIFATKCTLFMYI